MTKKSILFVDDEPNILSGLKRMFRVLRQVTDYHFIESGPAALDFMAEHHVDVIVSDMRMPGMDGAALLAIVQEKFPHIIRLMLTGQADEKSILQTVAVVHQFIAKPSTPETLHGILDRTCALQEVLQNDHLQSSIAKRGSLPSLPAVLALLQRTLKRPECSLDDIAAVIKQDLAISAKILQLANSAFFGLYNDIVSLSRAVSILGVDTIKSLVRCEGVFTELNPATVASSIAPSLWQHSMEVAVFAEKITQMENDAKELAETAFLAGFMHDIGKLVFFSSVQEQYLPTLELVKSRKIPPDQAEQQLFNATHGQVGGYLLGLWGLPLPVVEIVLFHHHPEQHPTPSFLPAVAVHAADVIYYRLHPDSHFGEPILNGALLKQAGMADRFDHWVTSCGEIVMESPPVPDQQKY